MKEILDASALDRALRRLAHEVAEKNDGLDGVVLVGHTHPRRMRGEAYSKLYRGFGRGNAPLGILDITLYRDDILSCDAVVKGTQIDFDIGGKTVVLCDDVLYTGRTVRAAISAVTALGGKLGRAKRIRLLEVIDRGHRELPFRCRLYRQKRAYFPKGKCGLYALRRRTARTACFFPTAEKINR